MEQSKKIVVKAKPVFSTKIICKVNNRPVSVTVFKNIKDNNEATKQVIMSFGPGAKNLNVTDIVLEKHY